MVLRQRVGVLFVLVAVGAGALGASAGPAEPRPVGAWSPRSIPSRGPRRRWAATGWRSPTSPPAGAEPHDLELTPDQVDGLLDADVAIVMGHDFQPAVEHSAAQRDGITVRLLDHLPTRAGDPHVWLDPVLMRRIVGQVRAALTRADPAGRATYARNAAALDAELVALDQRYRVGLRARARAARS